MTNRGSPNAWGLPDDTTMTLHGDAEGARRLADRLLGRGFDVAYSYQKRSDSPFPHAIANTQLFLDYPHAGRRFPYRMIPITVNCYGQHAIARRGGLARFAEIADGDGWIRSARPRAVLCAGPGRGTVVRRHRPSRRVGRLVELVARVPHRQDLGTSPRTPRRTSTLRPVRRRRLRKWKDHHREIVDPVSTKCSTGLLDRAANELGLDLNGRSSSPPMSSTPTSVLPCSGKKPTMTTSDSAAASRTIEPEASRPATSGRLRRSGPDAARLRPRRLGRPTGGTTYRRGRNGPRAGPRHRRFGATERPDESSIRFGPGPTTCGRSSTHTASRRPRSSATRSAVASRSDGHRQPSGSPGWC